MHLPEDIPGVTLGVEAGLLKVTKRQFESKVVELVSLALDQLSVQSLVWAVASIREDRMTPC